MGNDPLVGVGVINDPDYPYVIVLPSGSLDFEYKGNNFWTRVSATLTLEKVDASSQRQIVASCIMFRNLSIAAQILVDAIVSNALDPAENDNIDELTKDFIDLFKETPSRTFEETLGFWGELVFIRNSINPDSAVKAWHSKFDNRYDFTNGNRRAEVKITIGRERHHHFSSNQLPASKDLELEIVSIVTEVVESGVSTADLFREIYAELKDPLAIEKFRKMFINFFHNDSNSAENLAFDYSMALKSILLFNPEHIPSPEMKTGVVSASWVSNLGLFSDEANLPSKMKFFEESSDKFNE